MMKEGMLLIKKKYRSDPTLLEGKVFIPVSAGQYFAGSTIWKTLIVQIKS